MQKVHRQVAEGIGTAVERDLASSIVRPSRRFEWPTDGVNPPLVHPRTAGGVHRAAGGSHLQTGRARTAPTSCRNSADYWPEWGVQVRFDVYVSSASTRFSAVYKDSRGEVRHWSAASCR